MWASISLSYVLNISRTTLGCVLNPTINVQNLNNINVQNFTNVFAAFIRC
jgi:hypothetical protein